MKRDENDDLVRAIACSSLHGLPPELIDRLTDGAALRDIGAGTTIHRAGDPPFLALVVRGLFRAYVIAVDGRMMTIRYCRRGALMGTGTLFNVDRPAGGNLSAVVDSQVLTLRPPLVRELAGADIRLTSALLRETSARVAEYINELQASAMATVRQRLARHLLDLATEHQDGDRLTAHVSQQGLASAVGTVREIVVRILHDMRAEGLVHTGRGHIELLDPERLDAETWRGF